MPEAQLLYERGAETIDWTADGTYVPGQVIQLRDGRAGVVTSDCTSGQVVGVYVRGVFEVAKTTTMVILPSSRLYWDHSANACHLLHRNDRDFYLGLALEDEASAATTARVSLNEWPVYTVSLEDGFASIPIQTAGFPAVHGNGEGVNLILQAANEAQKVDALSYRGMAPASEGIFHALINVVANGSAGAVDFNVGVANATHATDADTITESMFVHIDGNNTNINLESDDGTTEVAATDTTVDLTAGTAFLAQFDMRDLTDIQAYIDGVNVLPASVFKLNAAAGPLKVLAHCEKTAATDTANYSVLYAGICIAQV